jgi:hypothetical protein
VEGCVKARLHPKWIGGRCGYLYSVIFEGKLLVERSKDPEHDAARALVGGGITGELTMLDGKTGKPRTIIDVAEAAKWRVEDGKTSLRRQKYREDGDGASPSLQTGVGGMTGPDNKEEAA